MDAKEYFVKKRRMTDDCGAECHYCQLGSRNNNRKITCSALERNFPDEAIAIVEKWSKEHPIMTNAQKFEEVFGWIPKSTDLFMGERQNHLPWWDEPYEGGE